MAGAEGFEPPANGFGDHRSSRLSYAPIKQTLQRFLEITL